MKPNWKPIEGDSFETKCFSGVIINEHVFFVPDITITCNPPYVKGVEDWCWVKYRKGNRPNTKKGWESLIGMSLQTMR